MSSNYLFRYKFVVILMTSCILLFILPLSREMMSLLMQSIVINRKVTTAC